MESRSRVNDGEVPGQRSGVEAGQWHEDAPRCKGRGLPGRALGSCVYRELYPGILMMQTTEHWLGEDRPKRFYRPEDRTVLGQ